MIDDRWRIAHCWSAISVLHKGDVQRLLDVLVDYSHLVAWRGYGTSELLMRDLIKSRHVYDGIHKLLTWWDKAGLQDGDLTHIFRKHRVSFGEADSEPMEGSASDTPSVVIILPNIFL